MTRSIIWSIRSSVSVPPFTPGATVWAAGIAFVMPSNAFGFAVASPLKKKDT